MCVILKRFHGYRCGIRKIKSVTPLLEVVDVGCSVHYSAQGTAAGEGSAWGSVFSSTP